MTDSLTTVRWRSWYIALVVAGILVNLLGLHSSILEPDGALYASIAKTMVLKGDWVNMYAHNRDWLDKPHFPFWMTAISYSIFGINEIAYKIPALVFWALGGWYTFLIARRLYSEQVAKQMNQQQSGKRIYQTNPLSYSLDFYSDGPVRYTDRAELVTAAKDSAVLYYSTREQRDTLVGLGIPVQVVDSFAHYHISKLKIGFLLPDKRPKYLQYRYLMEVGPRP